MASLDKLRRRPEKLYIPSHGPEVADGPSFTRALLGHRRQREAAILRTLEDMLEQRPFAEISVDDLAKGVKGFKSGLADDEPASPAPPTEHRNERPDPV